MQPVPGGRTPALSRRPPRMARAHRPRPRPRRPASLPAESKRSWVRLEPPCPPPTYTLCMAKGSNPHDLPLLLINPHQPSRKGGSQAAIRFFVFVIRAPGRRTGLAALASIRLQVCGRRMKFNACATHREILPTQWESGNHERGSKKVQSSNLCGARRTLLRSRVSLGCKCSLLLSCLQSLFAEQGRCPRLVQLLVPCLNFLLFWHTGQGNRGQRWPFHKPHRT
jgi:hypothetical protein